MACTTLGHEDAAPLKARIVELENAIAWYVDHVLFCEGTDFLSQAEVWDEPHATVIKQIVEWKVSP